MQAEFLWEPLSTFLAISGTLINQLFFGKSAKNIRVAIFALENLIEDVVESEYAKLYNHFRDTTEELLLSASRDSQSIDMGSILSEESNLKTKVSTVRDIHFANKYIDKWDSCLVRILIYRWTFGILLVSSLFLWGWNTFLPEHKSANLTIVLAGFSIIVLVVLFLDFLMIQNSIDKASRKYGLQ